MTIPTRPAPAPPGTRATNSGTASGAISNNYEQLRLQLQQQQHLGSLQNISIKLPPPPKGKITTNSNNSQGILRSNNNNINDFNATSITRKFPQARYTPSTNWDDDPFEMGKQTSQTNNGNSKKVPPPRPPPPKVVVNGSSSAGFVRKASAPARPPPHTSTNILNNLFHKRKAQKAVTTVGNANGNSASRVYGVSSGNNTKTYTAQSSSSTVNNVDWNACWNTVSTTSITTSTGTLTTTSNITDQQLISFDSPPSSPTFTQKSASDCVSVDSFSSDSNFSSPNNGSVSQPESGFEDDFNSGRSSSCRPPTTNSLDPWESVDPFGATDNNSSSLIGTAPVRNLNSITLRSNAHADNPLCNGKSLLPPTTTIGMPTIIKPKVSSQKPKAPKPPGLLQFQQRHTNSTYAFESDLQTPPSPPMPQFAPPPAPQLATTGTAQATVSILDVISGKVDALQLGASAMGSYDPDDSSPAYGVALYDFEGAEEGDLSFRENEKIYLLEQVSAEWFRGRTRTGCEGIFPSNYIEIKIPLKMESQGTGSSRSSSRASNNPKVRCMYNFPAEMAGDLALKENDEVTILYKINEDWLYGEIDGRQGQFPANFLEYLPNNLIMAS